MRKDTIMMNMKTLAACGLMLLPLTVKAQSCCENGNKAGGQEVKACCQMDNEVVRAIMARRSVRRYKDKAVEHEKLALIAKCGINAPNAMNKQTWAVRVVESPEFINATTEVFRKENPDMVKRDAHFKNMYRNAPNIIIVACAADDDYGLLNAGLMGENMMLAAQSLGLGTCCLGGAARFLEQSAGCREYVKRLNIPQGYQICYVLAVGYPDEAPEAKPRDEGKVEFIK